MQKKIYFILGLFTFLFVLMHGIQIVIADQKNDHIECEQEGEHESDNEDSNHLINSGITPLELFIIGALIFYIFNLLMFYTLKKKKKIGYKI